MVSIITYIVIAIVLSFLSYRSYVLMKEKENPFAVYFLGSFGAGAIGQILGLFLIAIAFIFGQNIYLYWSEITFRPFLYFSAAFFVQIPLHLYFPSSKKRHFASALILMYSAALFVWSLFLRYTPTIDPIGLINWKTPEIFGLAYGLPLLIIWVSGTIVFLVDYIKDKAIKSLVMAVGFFLMTVGGVGQNFTSTVVHYILVNLTMLAGFITIFLSSVFGREQKK